jgi:hypothetical protein
MIAVGSYGTRNVVVIRIIGYMERPTDCIVLSLCSLLLSEFSCQRDSPNPVAYSPEMDLISQPRSYTRPNLVP